MYTYFGKVTYFSMVFENPQLLIMYFKTKANEIHV